MFARTGGSPCTAPPDAPRRFCPGSRPRRGAAVLARPLAPVSAHWSADARVGHYFRSSAIFSPSISSFQVLRPQECPGQFPTNSVSRRTHLRQTFCLPLSAWLLVPVGRRPATVTNGLGGRRHPTSQSPHSLLLSWRPFPGMCGSGCGRRRGQSFYEAPRNASRRLSSLCGRPRSCA